MMARGGSPIPTAAMRSRVPTRCRNPKRGMQVIPRAATWRTWTRPRKSPIGPCGSPRAAPDRAGIALLACASDDVEQQQQDHDAERHAEQPEDHGHGHLLVMGWLHDKGAAPAAVPGGSLTGGRKRAAQMATNWRTPCASMSLPRPRAMTSPRSITA